MTKLDTERKQALFDWLGSQRRVMSFGPDVSDVSDEKEREAIALWLDKQIGDFLTWQMLRKVNSKPVLERTDYVNEVFVGCE